MLLIGTHISESFGICDNEGLLNVGTHLVLLISTHISESFGIRENEG